MTYGEAFSRNVRCVLQITYPPIEEATWEHLDHDPAPERDFVGDKDPRHPAAAELALDQEPGAERGLELFAKIQIHAMSLALVKRREVGIGRERETKARRWGGRIVCGKIARIGSTEGPPSCGPSTLTRATLLRMVPERRFRAESTPARDPDAEEA